MEWMEVGQENLEEETGSSRLHWSHFRGFEAPSIHPTPVGVHGYLLAGNQHPGSLAGID